ncbi:hypothetical protein tb265_41150 [Gemmatimonadetes bacterium T265]|nr:hypothetical protein tb265_41150 [Gemmatimonadetes bacterium T265]
MNHTVAYALVALTAVAARARAQAGGVPAGYELCTQGGSIARSVILVDATTGRGVPWRLVPAAHVAWRAGQSSGIAQHLPNFGPLGGYPTEGTADGVGIGIVWGRPGVYHLPVSVPGYRAWDTAGVRVPEGAMRLPYGPASCGVGRAVVVVARLRPDTAAARAYATARAAARAAARADTLPTRLQPALVVDGLEIRAAAGLVASGVADRFTRVDSARRPSPDTTGSVLRVEVAIANRGARAATVCVRSCGLDLVLYPANAAPVVEPDRTRPTGQPPDGARVPPAWRSVGGAETRIRVGAGRNTVGCRDPAPPQRLAPRRPPRAGRVRGAGARGLGARGHGRGRRGAAGRLRGRRAAPFRRRPGARARSRAQRPAGGRRRPDERVALRRRRPPRAVSPPPRTSRGRACGGGSRDVARRSVSGSVARTAGLAAAPNFGMPISPYVRALRSHVGAMRLLFPSVSVHVFDAERRLLLVRQRDGGVWSTPGGLIEPDERPADAAVREAWEETGLVVRLERVLGVYGGPECVVRYPNGDETQYMITAFGATVVGGAPRPEGDETTAVRYWAEADAGGLPLAPWLRALLPVVYGGPTGVAFTPPTWASPTAS